MYGTGFKFNFTDAPSQTAAVYRAVSGVTEYDLTTGVNDGRAWTCDASLIFTVVNSPADNGHGISCSATNTTPVTAAQQAAAANGSLYAMLPTGLWTIDFVNRCVVPKTAPLVTCTGTSPAVVSSTVYNGYCSTANGHPCPSAGLACNPALNNCPHFVSICTRN
jgi:hypothetical protein